MPENWKTYKLGEILQIKNGKTKPKNKGIYPIYGGNGILGYGDKTNLNEEAILIGRVGAYCGAVYYENRELWVSDNSLFGIAKNKNNSKFIYYLLKKANLNQFSTGSSQPLLTQGTLNSLEFEIPENDSEQRAIANILSAIDDKIENNLAMNKTLEDMAMTLYKHWFVDFGQELENTLADYVNLNPRLSIKKGELASYVNMKALPTEGMSVSEVDKVVVKGGAKFQNGDTLLARITPCLENGKTAYVDFLEENEIGFGSTEFLVLRAKEGISKYWVYCLSRDINLVNHAVSCMIGTSGRQRVQNDPFLQYELPEINEETMVSFEKKVEPWFKKVKANTNENQTLTKLRDTLLPKLISGEVRLKEFEEEITAAL
ncbi:restriction endonuclease subunit S [uncultured Kriegella sp.]|uniref:restriction endonuclease subunit S n=1 Tax=uncultured Kriegella sp. TaxID=1798910 RepID=UPI0030DBE6EF|tara:strand:+ start:147 stop:1265 length:1119 start_codon:yes stop_codon:yes gene_type:complete